MDDDDALGFEVFSQAAEPPALIPAAVLQVIGLVCLLVAVAVLYDGWYVLGAFGIALVFGRTNDVADGARAIARRSR
jgi:hypothetical protein